jgi:hypothetical protein
MSGHHEIAGHKIRTEFIYPPIPVRSFDWCATEEDYEPGRPMGFGEREEEAIADLIEQLEDAIGHAG